MVLRRVLLEDSGLILPLQTQKERNQPLYRDQGTSVPLMPLDRGPLDIIDSWADFRSLLPAITPCVV